MLTIYHGTCSALKRKILTDGSLSPKRGNSNVYVTTDLEVAKNYSRAWTAWSLENGDDIEAAFGFRPEPKGLIIKTIIQEDCLTEDPYNPEGEPNQYMVKGSLWLDDAEMIEVDFTEKFADPGEVTRAYAYWIGIGRATDNG